MMDLAEKLYESLDLDFVEKKMKKEDFEEHEHPRDSSGKFTDKPGDKVAKKRKISDRNKKIAKGAVITAAGAAAVTLAVLALRRSSVLKTQVDEAVRATDEIIKEAVSKSKKTVEEVASKVDEKISPSRAIQKTEAPPTTIKENLEKVDDLTDIAPAKSSPKPVPKKEPKIDLDKDLSEESAKVVRTYSSMADESINRVFKTNFNKKKSESVEEFNSRLSDLKKTFSGRIENGYWTEDNFIDPLFSLNRLKKTGDITSRDYDNVVRFYENVNKELQKEIQYLTTVGEYSPVIHKRLTSAFNESYYALISARFKKTVYLGKITESSPDFVLYRQASDKYFDTYAPLSRKIEDINVKLQDETYKEVYPLLKKQRQKLIDMREPHERVYKILNSDANTIKVKPEDISGFDNDILKDNRLDELANRYAKDHGVYIPDELKVGDVGLAYERGAVRGARRAPTDRELRKSMLRERVQRKYKNKNKVQIDEMVEELMKKEKGFDRDLEITEKAMTEEQFEEHEHPRDRSGKFTKKPGSGEAPKVKSKSSHGGYRKFAGRLPKNVAEAVEIQKQKYKQKFPNASEQEITNKLVEYGEKKNKGADWYLYVSNKEKYDKIQTQRMKDAEKSRRNVAYANGQKVTWRPPEDVKNSIREQSNRFRRDVAKYKSIRHASQKFMDKEAPTQERNAARLILTVGTVASALSLFALFSGRPRLLYKRVKEPFKYSPAEGKMLPEFLSHEVNTAAASVPVEPRLFQLNQVVGMGRVTDNFRQIESANSFNQTLSNFIAKRIAKKEATGIRKEAFDLLESGKPIAITFGPGKAGYKGERFLLHDRYIVNFWKRKGVKDLGRRADYRHQVGDKGFFGNEWLEFADKDGVIHPTAIKRIFELKLGNNKYWRNPKNWPEGLIYEPNTKVWKWRRVSRHSSGKLKGSTSMKSLVRFAERKGWIIKKDIQAKKYMLNPEGKLFPDRISRRWSQSHREAKMAFKEIEGYKGWAGFMEENIGGISRKALSVLALTPGVGPAMYYFSMDIKDAAGTIKKEREKDRKQELAFNREYEEKESRGGKRTKTNSPKKKSEAETIEEDEIPVQRDVTPDFESQDEGGVSEGAIPKDELDNLSPDVAERVREATEMKTVNQTIVDDHSEYRGFGGDLVIKEYDSEEVIDIDVTDAVAIQIADDIANISQACKYAIESGMPGSDQFVQINNKLVEMYAVLKDKAREEQ